MTWADRALRHLNTLDARIAALDGRMYCGAGFHYDKHRRAENLRRMIGEGTDDRRIEIVWQVFLAGLTRDIVKAERSAERYAHG